MKYIFFLFVTALSLAAGDITVYRKGKDAWIQSRFSDKEDIVIRIWLNANEKAYLVPRGSDIRDAEKKGRLLHANSDEYAATSFVNYGYLSGNHGSAYARAVTAPDHGFVNADSGKIITDAKQNKYVFVRTLNKNRFVMHPLNTNPAAPIGRASFPVHRKEKLFFNGKEIKFTSSAVVQLRPFNLMIRNQFLIDGKTPLSDGKVVKCRFLDHVFEHDVIAPEAAVDYIIKKKSARTAVFFTIKQKMFYPDEEKGFEDFAKLPTIMRVKNRFRYEDNGAMVNYRSCTYPLSLPGVDQLEVMFGWGGGVIAKGKYQRFYIPKTRPVALRRYRSRSRDKVDLVKGVDITAVSRFNDRLKSALDKNNPPDRFIRVSGKNSPEYGIALGYSLIEGDMALGRKAPPRTYYYFHWHTRKIYPYAYQLWNNKPGTTVSTVSYKQYFAPQNEPDATSSYYHTQGKSTVVYFETHKNLKNKVLNLPASFAGRKFSVVEKTPSVTLFSKEKVPGEGIRFSVNNGYGYLVIRVD